MDQDEVRHEAELVKSSLDVLPHALEAVLLFCDNELVVFAELDL